MKRYQNQLRRQLEFIWRSCRSFDEGNQEEAVRVAIAIRVLVHDTKSSTSLLSHLSAKNIKLLSTGKELEDLDKSICYESELTHFANGEWTAQLDDSDYRIELLVDEWWNQVVTVIPPGIKVSRRQLVLDTADKDGGTHVDKTIPARLAALIDSGWVVMIHDDQETPTEQKVHNHHFHYLRQLGYELLHSPELLALVGSDFSLPNDKTIKQQQAEALRTSLERIASLQETGEKMAQSGDLLVARQVFDTLIKELEPAHDEVSLEILARIFLSKAKTFSSREDTEKAIAVYAHLLNAFNGRTIIRGDLKEIFIKTQFAKAAAHALLNQKEPAIEYFQYVYRNTKVLIENQQLKLGFYKILEPVKYILASINNIIVFHLNTGSYEKVIESSDELLKTFFKIMNVNSDCQTLQQILLQLDDIDASIIRGHLSKCLRNKLLALTALGKVELAREACKDFERKFTTGSESILQQCLNELSNVLKELSNVLEEHNDQKHAT